MTKELTTAALRTATEATDSPYEPSQTAKPSTAMTPEDQQHQQKQPPRKKRAKIMSACSECRRKKTKCNGEQPCRNCQKSNASCIYSTAASSGSNHLNTGQHINIHSTSSMAASDSNKRYFHYHHPDNGNSGHQTAPPAAAASKAALEAIEDRLKAIEDMLQTIIQNNQHYQLPVLQNTAAYPPYQHRPEIIRYDYPCQENSYNNSNSEYDDKHRLPSIHNISSGVPNPTTATSSTSVATLTAAATATATSHTYQPHPSSAFSTVSQQFLPPANSLRAHASADVSPTMHPLMHTDYNTQQQQHSSSSPPTGSSRVYTHRLQAHPPAFEPIGKRKREDMY